MDALEENPCINTGFDLRERHIRKKRQCRRTPLDAVQ